MADSLLVAGVDTSTQSCKVVVCDAKTGAIVREGSAKHPDGTECHPDAWWTALHEAVAAAGGVSDVQAISVGGQQHGMVLLDEDGEVLRPALLWNDTRSADAANELMRELGEGEFAKATGSELVASITITKVRWVAESECSIAKRIAAICLPHDWISWRLAGYGPASQGQNPDLSKLTTDRSDASGTGYFDATQNGGKGGYRRDLLELALKPLGSEIASHLASTIVLPRVLQASEAGNTMNYGSNTHAPIGPGGGDNAMAALGLGLSVGSVSVSLGTSGVVAAVSPTPTNDPTGAVNGFADCTGNYLPLACTLNASRDIDAGKEILGVDYDEFGELALKSEPGAAGLSLVPYFEGERMPNRPRANASLFGMTLKNCTRENIARAFIEGMLSGLNDGLVEMQKLGVPIEKIYMIGGSMKSPAVRAIAPAVFGKEITLPDSAEYVALGAARQAAWVLSGSEEAPAWQNRGEELISAAATPVVTSQFQKVKDLKTLGEL